MAAVTGLHILWCQASDMGRSVAFYRDVLGLKLEFESPYWSQFELGAAKLGIHPQLKDSTPPLGMVGKGWYLGLGTNDVKGLRDKLAAAGVPIHGDFHDVPGGVVLDFEDPEGNPIEAHQTGVNTASLN